VLGDKALIDSSCLADVSGSSGCYREKERLDVINGMSFAVRGDLPNNLHWIQMAPLLAKESW
jgi:hypothetical protein